jgi:glycosyltransferase involved in cell wall biosynthesis
MRFLIDISDLGSPLPNKYKRVVRALSAESEAGGGIVIEIADGGQCIVSAHAPSEILEPVWWHVLPCSRFVSLTCSGRAIKLLAFYFGSKFVGKTLTYQRKTELAWNLAYSLEIFTPSWRKCLAEFLEVDSDLTRNLNFFHWLGERGFITHRTFESRNRGVTEPVSIEEGDILVLAGTSWRYDIEALQKLKKANGLRLVCLVYDLLPIDYPSLVTVQQRQQYKEFLYGIGRIADLIITPNRFTESRLKTFLAQKGICSAVLATVSLSSVSLMGQGSISQRLLDLGLQGKKFMLCVGALRERKHILWLYALCATLRLHQTGSPLIVFAGPIADLTIIRYLASDPAWGDAGTFIETPDDSELSWLYQNACLCLQPSFEGGLNMAVMEAINYGRTCIAADTPSAMEASAGRAMHLPYDEAIWAGAIQSQLQNGDSLRMVGASLMPSQTTPSLLSQIRALIEEDQLFSRKKGSVAVR